jgi:hypothetical protein
MPELEYFSVNRPRSVKLPLRRMFSSRKLLLVRAVVKAHSDLEKTPF